MFVIDEIRPLRCTSEASNKRNLNILIQKRQVALFFIDQIEIAPHSDVAISCSKPFDMGCLFKM